MLDALSGLPLDAYDLVPPVEALDIPLHSVNNRSLGLRTGAGDLIWKTYGPVHSVEALRYEHALLLRLATRALPFELPVPLAARDGATLRRGPHGWGALMRRLPGFPLNPADPAQVELLGAACGELIAALAALRSAPRPGRALFAALFDFPPLGRPALALAPRHLGLPATEEHEQALSWWRDEAAVLAVFATGPFRALPQQLCHNDMAPANVLVHDGRISAVLDFEFALPAARAFDAAMGLRMTMRVWENPAPWEALRRFMRGYTRHAPFTPEEARATPTLIRLRSAIPVLWWLGRADEQADAATVLRGIGFQQNYARWLAANQQQFVEELLAWTR
jgi:Ser/Thr protein kinase RdoA (MazF antagonist)